MAIDLKNLDLNNIELKDVAGAPMAVKALLAAFLFAVLTFGGYYLDWSDQLSALNAKKNEELSLRTTYTDKKKQAIHFEAYKKRLDDTEKALSAMLRQLPNKAEMDALLTDINQTGIGRGLEFQLFKPSQEQKTDFYATLPVTIKVTGAYHDLAYFISDIAKLSRIVTLHNVALAPIKAGEETLTLNATINTYRYLDPSEQPESEQNKKGEKNKKNPKKQGPKK